MSFKKKKNKRFDKPKPTIRKDKLMMHMDSIEECIKQANEYIEDAPGYSLQEVVDAITKFDKLNEGLETLYDKLDTIEYGFYKAGIKL